MDLFRETNRSAGDLFYTRNDPNDIRLGDIVKRTHSDYDTCGIVILGIPQDIGVKRNRGRVGARHAPTAIRRELYKLAAPKSFDALSIYDLGDLAIAKTLEATHERQIKVAEQILRDDRKLIVLGGGHDITYPDFKAFSNAFPTCALLNIDTHLDVREDTPRNSGTSYRMILDENLVNPECLYQIGIQPFANSSAYMEYVEEKKVKIYTLDEIRRRGVDGIHEEIFSGINCEELFVSFDMDAVRSADAPGVSASYPKGLSVEEMIYFAHYTGRDGRARVIEVAEVNPNHDVESRTSKLGALLVWEYLYGLMHKGTRSE
jgi:formiminoglutamase